MGSRPSDAPRRAGELAAAEDRGRFFDALAELVELVSDCRVLVSRTGDELIVGEFLVTVERSQE